MRIEPTFGDALPQAIPLDQSTHNRTGKQWVKLGHRLAHAFSVLALSLILVPSLFVITMPSLGTSDRQRLAPPNPSRQVGGEKSVAPLPNGHAAYEGSKPDDRSLQGVVTWTQVSNGSNDAVRATLYFSDRRVTVTVTLSKNNEPSLKANYLIEIQVIGSFAEAPVRAVPKIIAKESRLEEGYALAGIPIPVTNYLFWYALSDSESEEEYNRGLLSTASWLQLTLLHEGAEESHLVFEINESGGKLLYDLFIRPGTNPPG
jgi:hypothetical protein